MPGRGVMVLVALTVAMSMASACSSDGGVGSANTQPPPTPVTFSPPTTASPPRIPWSRLRNPIYGQAARATKDPALVAVNNEWFLLFSNVDRAGTWRVGVARSRDLTHWSKPWTMTHDPSTEGEASPDVVRAPDGTLVVTYQSFVHDRGGALAKLYYRTTADFRHFSSPHPLGRALHPAATDRMIDPALAWTPAGLLLGYKYGARGDEQAFEIARSTSGTLGGPWRRVGRPNIRVYRDTIENHQFLLVQDVWRLLATTNTLDRPFLFELEGDPTKPKGWLNWSKGRRLEVPQEPWNPGSGVTGTTYEHANSAFLVDERAVDNRFYLVYADDSEMSSFGGQGHSRLGIARSTDLVDWAVPPH